MPLSFASGLTRNRKCRMTIGTRTLVHSRSVAKAPCRKTFLLSGQAAKGKAVSQSRGKPTVTQTFKRFPASFQPITGINPRNPEIHPLSSKQDRRGVALCVRLPAPEPPCLLPAKLKPKPKPPPPPTPVVEPAGAKSLTASPKTTSDRIGFNLTGRDMVV